MSVLKLANLWTLDSLRKKSVEESEELFQEKSCINKVLLGRKYKVSKWLIEGYEGLGKRLEGVDDNERAMLGADSFAMVVQLRERFFRHMTNKYDEAYPAGTRKLGQNNYTLSALKDGFDFSAVVKEIFRDELMQDREYIP